MYFTSAAMPLPVSPVVAKEIAIGVTLIAIAIAIRLARELPSLLGRRLIRRRQVFVQKFKAVSESVGGSYRLKPSIATKGELAFLPALRIAVGDQRQIMCSVRLADIFYVESGHPQWQYLMNRITSKHVDFVICEAGTLRPLVLVELDDPTHKRLDRIDRDKFVDAVAFTAGIPIIHSKTAFNCCVIEESLHSMRVLPVDWQR